MPPPPDAGDMSLALLGQIQTTLQIIQRDYQQLAAALDVINGKLSPDSEVKEVHDVAREIFPDSRKALIPMPSYTSDRVIKSNPELEPESATCGEQLVVADSAGPPRFSPRPSGSSRIILTTYPGQSGIDPLAMRWGHSDPSCRGPVIVSRSQSTIRRRNGMFLQNLSYTSD